MHRTYVQYEVLKYGLQVTCQSEMVQVLNLTNQVKCSTIGQILWRVNLFSLGVLL